MTVKGTWKEVALEKLLRESETSGEVSLDAVGEAIGGRAVSQDEIDAILEKLEKAGRKVGGEPAKGVGVGRLQKVLATARELRAELGRSATPQEIADRSGLDSDAVRHALELAKVMQR